MAEHNLPDSQAMIDVHGDFLYRFAFTRVGNRDVAEDLVQETFLAALQGTYRESGPTAERRWMIGIMKHKIIDHFRRKAKEPIQHPEQPEDQPVEEAFLPDGHWKPHAAGLQAWPERPDGLVERREFWDTLAGCMECLSPRAAQIFTLRELDELDIHHICELLQLTPTNFSVILHRTRKQLRDCLANRYFGRVQEDMKP